MFGNLKFTLRLFVKQIGSSLMGVFVLAAGLALAICMFALANGILWSSPQANNQQKLVELAWVAKKKSPRAGNGININDYEEIVETNTSFSQLSVYRTSLAALYHPDMGGAKSVKRADVSANFFDLIGQKPLLGELPTLDKKDNKKVVLSYDVWVTDFSSDPNIIGKSVQLYNVPHEIAAIMPSGFHFPLEQQLWIVSDFKYYKKRARTIGSSFKVLGVLKQGITPKQAKLSLANIAEGLKEKFPEINKNYSHISVTNFGDEYVSNGMKANLFMLLGFSLIVLFIACSNVSNLVMVRVAKRQHELAVRKSLGANNKNIIWQVVLDSFVLAFFGVLFALLFAGWGARYVWSAFSSTYYRLPYWWHMDIDYKVFAFAIVIALLSIGLASIVPSLRVISKQSFEVLKDSTRTSSGLAIGKIAKVIITIQIALATVLLCTAFSQYFVIKNQTQRDFTFNPAQVIMTHVLADSDYRTDDAIEQFFTEYGQQLRSVPEIKAVTLSTVAPGVGARSIGFEIDGQEIENSQEKSRTRVPIVDDYFFDAFNIKLLQGRLFNTLDTNDSQKVAIVNQYFVDQYLADEDPIGKRIRVDLLVNGKNKDEKQEDWLTIVGVVSNDQNTDIANSQKVHNLTGVYLPYSQHIKRIMSVLVVGQEGVEHYGRIIRSKLANINSKLATFSKLMTVEQNLDSVYLLPRLIRNSIIVFAFIALLMSAVGLYALVVFTTQQRYREFGIRMVLGASAKQILLLVMRNSKWPITIGVTLGLCGGYFTNNFMPYLSKGSASAELLNNVVLSYPLSFFFVIFITVIAILLPAKKATQIPTNVALRAE